MQRGSVVRLIRDRGFGFIKMENGQEIFFHATGVVGYPFDNLAEGQAVSFEIGQDTRGRGQRAVNVRLRCRVQTLFMPRTGHLTMITAKPFMEQNHG